MTKIKSYLQTPLGCTDRYKTQDSVTLKMWLKKNTEESKYQLDTAS
jgi:hypothetical protein